MERGKEGRERKEKGIRCEEARRKGGRDIGMTGDKKRRETREKSESWETKRGILALNLR